MTGMLVLALVAALSPGARAGHAEPAPGDSQIKAPGDSQIKAPGDSQIKAPGDSQIKADVQQRLKGLDLGPSRLTVDVQDGVVTLSGTVPTLWLKDEAVSRARKAGNVQSLVADLTIPKAENDLALAREVSDRIRHYDLYSVYDNIDGGVHNGVVKLAGAVTEPKKAADILERVAKIRGVQAIDNHVDVLPVSQSDDRLRVRIATAIYSDPAFENYSRVDPPIRVIVNNGHVTLVGVVRAELERFKAESITRMIPGVLAFENKVQVPSGRK
jgi:osmotically-inducible protein OsmY